MNERQKRFADEYIRTVNVYQSAITAGYSDGYARSGANALLDNIRIKSYIDARLDKLKKESIAEQDEILQFLTKIVRGEEAETIPLGMGMGEQSLVKKELDGNDRIKAAELLGKRYAMWTDRQQVEDVTPTFINDVPEND